MSPDRLVPLPPWLSREEYFFLVERCVCGHARFEHSLTRGWWERPCFRCGCGDFDDLDARAGAWIREQQDKAARERAKAEAAGWAEDAA